MHLADIDYSTSTALVTGGSSGIGRAIAAELASRGLSKLILVAHNPDNLASAASAITSASPGTSVRTISVDLATHDGPAKVQTEVEGWDWTVDILVNDAGLARKQSFAANGVNDVSLHTVDLMIRAVVDLSLRFLPSMVRRQKDAGRGLGLLNVCSTAAYNPVPYTAMYAASKAFMLSWTQAVREEQIQADSGVRIACVVPGITETNLDGDGHGERRGMLDVVGIHQPEEVAVVAVDALEQNAASKIVGFNNSVLQVAQNFVPSAMMAASVAKARGAPEEGDNLGVKHD